MDEDFDLGFNFDTNFLSNRGTLPDDGLMNSQERPENIPQADRSPTNPPEHSEVPQVVIEGSQEYQLVDTLTTFGVYNSSSTANPAELESDRFPDISADDLEAYAAGNVNSKTKRCTEWGYNVYNRWRESYLHYHPGTYVPKLCEMDRDKVKKWIPLFFMAARNKKGEPYPRGSMHALACAVKRKMIDYNITDTNFFDKSDLDFKSVRDVLDRRMKEVTADGTGLHRKKAKAITTSEECDLWNRGIFGTENATTLQNTVFFYVAKLFALRGGEELRKVKVEDFEFEHLPEGKAVHFRGGKCKNFHGGLSQLKQEPKSVLHISPHGSDPCIVRIFETYINAIGSTNPFFRKPLEPRGVDKFRYSKQAVGHNSLSKKMSQICQAGGLTGYYTNHSARRSVASQMFNEGMDEQLIMDRTGHRSVDGVRQYKQTARRTILKVSTLIGPPPKAPKKGDHEQPSTSGTTAIERNGDALSAHASQPPLSTAADEPKPGWYPTAREKEIVTQHQVPNLDMSAMNSNTHESIAEHSSSTNTPERAHLDSASSLNPTMATVENTLRSIFNSSIMKNNNIHIHFHSPAPPK